VLFYDILDVSAINAYIIWLRLNPQWHDGKTHRRRLFLKQLGKELALPHMISRLRVPGLPIQLKTTIEECIPELYELQRVGEDDAAQNDDEPAGAHNIAHKRKQGRCTMCDRNKDKKSRSACQKCGSFACTDHMMSICKRCTE